MKFTYQDYRMLLQLLKEQGYQICGYHDNYAGTRCAILRHDIDMSIEAALEMARLEEKNGVQSTYFVLLTSNFYNAASAKSRSMLKEIQALGHEIGLHFDETAYDNAGEGVMVKYILQECGLLSTLLDTQVSTVSMHRPSRAALEADLQIPGIVNSYGKTFFREFKYLSDSRRHWREPVLDIIRSGMYDHLHILTHAFWYREHEETISESVGGFICSANRERYYEMKENISNMEEILPVSEICPEMTPPGCWASLE